MYTLDTLYSVLIIISLKARKTVLESGLTFVRSKNVPGIKQNKFEQNALPNRAVKKTDFDVQTPRT